MKKLLALAPGALGMFLTGTLGLFACLPAVGQPQAQIATEGSEIEVAIDVAGARDPQFREAIERAVSLVKPALVRIQVVETNYGDGRAYKVQASGSGVIITSDGHVVTNHHVAGHAKRIVCTLENREEVSATLVGTDAMTDIAVLKLENDGARVYPTARWGDSSLAAVGDHVLAMGSPGNLSQSVTLGIISNAELVQPEWLGRYRGMELDGEDVGSLVRWIGHDAQLYGGNSGGPLVNLHGEVIGINEIGLSGLGGAIPGNLARSVADELMADGEVTRAWLGVIVQKRLKYSDHDTGVLVSGVLKKSSADVAGLQAGDIILRVGDTPVDVGFLEQIPDFNLLVASLPIGEPVTIRVLRGDETRDIVATPERRQRVLPEETELRQWGVTARDLSFMLAAQLRRDSQEGVLVNSLRPSGPAASAKPSLQRRDVILEVAGRPTPDLAALRAVTEEITADQTEPVPTLVAFERDSERYITVVEVGIRELDDPGLEVRKAWLPVRTQVLTRDIAQQLGDEGLTGFRVTQVYAGSTADEAGLQIGDYLLAVDGERLRSSAPEDYDDLPALIRQYRIGDTVELTLLRDGERMSVPVALAESPRAAREMKRYRDTAFEFTARDITFFDKAEKQWDDQMRGVLVEEIESGGWAAVADLQTGDLILEVAGRPVPDVETLERVMNELAESRPDAVVLKVLQGIRTAFLEVEPTWDDAEPNRAATDAEPDSADSGPATE